MISSRRPTTRQIFESFASQARPDEATERNFFTSVLLSNGTFKTTAANRLDDVNEAVFSNVAGITDRPIQLMDVAISSGITTFEWYEQLKSKGVCCQITATDLIFYASLVNCLFDTLSVLIDKHGNILHIDAVGHGVLPTKGVRGALIHPCRALFAAVVRAFFRTTMKIDKHLPPLRGEVTLAAEGRILKCEPITLLTKKLAECQNVRIMEDDLLAENLPEFDRAFHVVRAANILSRVYFSDVNLIRMVRTLIHRLKDHGLFILCRTMDGGANHATIFQLTPNRKLSVLMRLGGGSEIEELIRGTGILV